MTAVSSTLSSSDVVRIPYVTAEEAYDLIQTALDRYLALIEDLGPEEWDLPTYCSEWSVRDILAHQAGSYLSGTSWKQLLRHVRQKPEGDQLMEDAVNAFHLSEREDHSPGQMIAELREMGPIAAKMWAYRFRPLWLVSLPHRDAGRLSLKHLNWVIHSRDTWMHRLDTCRATGREFIQTREHDGRIVELVMLDVADNLARRFGGPALAFNLTGIAGGSWNIGKGEPAATVTMDALDFNVFASGRFSYKEARPLMTITGDVPTAEAALKTILVVY